MVRRGSRVDPYLPIHTLGRYIPSWPRTSPRFRLLCKQRRNTSIHYSTYRNDARTVATVHVICFLFLVLVLGDGTLMIPDFFFSFLAAFQRSKLLSFDDTQTYICLRLLEHTRDFQRWNMVLIPRKKRMHPLWIGSPTLCNVYQSKSRRVMRLHAQPADSEHSPGHHCGDSARDGACRVGR